MKIIQIYDKPMCCSTGVCGPQVDPVLPRFAADLDWLRNQGLRVERFNLAQQPQAFLDSARVQQLVTTLGTKCLPLVVIDGDIVSRGQYPTREQLAGWTGLAVSNSLLRVVEPGDECCGPSCC
jgi:hypothetical protein